MEANRGRIAAASLGALLAACTPPHPHHHDGAPLRAISTLTCPATEGELKRVGAVGGGARCDYADDAGDKVTLSLLALGGGDAKTALAPLEARLQAELPAVSSGADVAQPSKADADKVDIDLPGIHIHSGGGGAAEVNAGGVHVRANDRGADVQSSSSASSGGHGGVTVNAAEGGARIRIDEGGAGARLSWILAGDAPGPNGYRMVGYEARGPAGGPLAVASILATTDHRHDEARHAMRRLLDLNVGG